MRLLFSITQFTSDITSNGYIKRTGLYGKTFSNIGLLSSKAQLTSYVTLKFEYSAIFSNLDHFFDKTQLTADTTSNVWIEATEKTKNIHFEKSHNAENCERGDILGFLKIQFVTNYQKN